MAPMGAGVIKKGFPNLRNSLPLRQACLVKCLLTAGDNRKDDGRQSTDDRSPSESINIAQCSTSPMCMLPLAEYYYQAQVVSILRFQHRG